METKEEEETFASHFRNNKQTGPQNTTFQFVSKAHTNTYKHLPSLKNSSKQKGAQNTTFLSMSTAHTNTYTQVYRNRKGNRILPFSLSPNHIQVPPTHTYQNRRAANRTGRRTPPCSPSPNHIYTPCKSLHKRDWELSSLWACPTQLQAWH